MAEFDPTVWTDFFVAAAGASAALAGLVFVAVSINIDRILSLPGVTERALETVLALLGVVLMSLIMLIPGLSDDTLAILLLTEAALLIALAVQINRQGRGSAEGTAHASRHFLRAMAAIPVLIGGASLLIQSGGGFYWIAAGVLLGILAGVINAWVLLVEILR